MPKRFRTGLTLLLLIAFSIPGLLRLTFITDILGILPAGVPEIEALQELRTHFAKAEQVVVLLKHEEEVFEQDATDLAEHLRKTLPKAQVETRSGPEKAPKAIAESLARLWMDADPQEVQRFTNNLSSQEALTQLLQDSRETIELSIDPQATTKAAYDPLGFLNHPALLTLQNNNLSFQSENGQYWLITIGNPDLVADYRLHSQWVEEIRAALDPWMKDGFSYRLTGGPVFSAELGKSMEKDMSGTVAMTCCLVAILFLLIQRNPIHLVFLTSIMALVFLITMGIAGWLFGTLNLVSVGFAAILLGLVIDYGVVIARESQAQESADETRRHLAPSILWAAFTTAAVFAVLILSSFQGVAQLGCLIAIGLGVGSVVCLWIMPWTTEKFPKKTAKSLTTPPFLKAHSSLCLLVLIVAACGCSFALKGLPKINFDLSMIEPETSEAAETLLSIQELFETWSIKNVSLLASGDSPQEIRKRLEATREDAHKMMEDGFLEGVELPLELIPNPEARLANHESWTSVAKKQDEILSVMKEQGFTERGRALTELILKEFAQGPTQLDAMTRVFYQPEGFFSGRVRLKEELSEESFDQVRALNREGVQVTGWDPLQFVLLPMVKSDFYLLSLPATVLLLLALGAVFRCWKDTLLTASILILVLLMINAMSSITGRSWNFLNGMSIPLIVGTGIDYSIHLIFSLRRNQGDLVKVWNGVGKAICFCGLSTAIGFGSLLFASNQLLQSMGLFCCSGVLLTMLMSLLIIPGIWSANQRGRQSSTQ